MISEQTNERVDLWQIQMASGYFRGPKLIFL